MGGLVAGILIAIMYYYNNAILAKAHVDLILLPLTLGYAALAVEGLCACAIQVGMQGLTTLASRHGYPDVLFNAVSGGVLGGAIAGAWWAV